MNQNNISEFKLKIKIKKIKNIYLVYISVCKFFSCDLFIKKTVHEMCLILLLMQT